MPQQTDRLWLKRYDGRTMIVVRMGLDMRPRPESLMGRQSVKAERRDCGALGPALERIRVCR